MQVFFKKMALLKDCSNTLVGLCVFDSQAFVFHSGKKCHISEPTEHVDTALCQNVVKIGSTLQGKQVI